ncbi:MAG TPA: EamA family transporter [Terriglobales bacterium]|nr:EamA family transporter [Terriglobales bacterium]
MSSANTSRYTLVLNFGLVYVFWGSTYLAIDIAVQHIPPALMCGTRFTIAGVIMLTYCLVRGEKVRYSPRRLLELAIIGNLLLMGGNLTLSYSEQYLASGLASMLVATIPLWFLVLDSLILRHNLVSGRAVAGLALGLVGTLVLLWPQLGATGEIGRRQLFWSVALIGGAATWAFGSVLSKKWQSGSPTFAETAWQVFFAGLGNLVFAFGNRDYARVVWTSRGIGAMAYLVVCGSLIGYTAYIYILSHATTAKVSTYAYVNPVVAVFLGWLVLHETVDRYVVIGSAIVVASVILVTTASAKPRSRQFQAAEAAAD